MGEHVNGAPSRDPVIRREICKGGFAIDELADGQFRLTVFDTSGNPSTCDDTWRAVNDRLAKLAGDWCDVFLKLSYQRPPR